MSLLFYILMVFIQLLYGLLYLYPWLLVVLFGIRLFTLYQDRQKKRMLHWIVLHLAIVIPIVVFYRLPLVLDALSIPYQAHLTILNPAYIIYMGLLSFLYGILLKHFFCYSNPHPPTNINKN